VSALKTTVIGILQTIPALLLGAQRGVYLDPVPKNPVVIGIDLIRAALVFLIPLPHLFDFLLPLGMVSTKSCRTGRPVGEIVSRHFPEFIGIEVRPAVRRTSA
jgi:hypothetical protein